MKRFLALTSILSVALVACQTGSSGDEGPIKVGLITPLTGGIASLGADILNGAKMMQEEINAAGGVNGRPIEIIAEDGRCTGNDAASAAQKLVNIDNVVVIHGAGCSGESLAAAPIAEAAEVVMISPSSSSPDLTTASDFFFRTYPSDALRTTAMAKHFSEEGYKNIAIVSENTDFCGAFRSQLMEKFGEENFVFDEMVEPGTKDFRTIFTRLKDLDFDVLVTNAQVPDVGAIMLVQLREQGITQPAIGHDVLDGALVTELAGEAAEGLKVVNVPTIGDESEFGKKFIEKYGEPQSNMAWGAYGYDTMGVIAQAVEKAGTEGTAIRDYLYGMSKYNGTVGKISFDENGDVVGIPIALREVKDGKFVRIDYIAVD